MLNNNSIYQKHTTRCFESGTWDFGTGHWDIGTLGHSDGARGRATLFDIQSVGCWPIIGRNTFGAIKYILLSVCGLGLEGKE
jgi:hypothetical protein